MSLPRCTSLALGLLLLCTAPADAWRARDTQAKILYLSDPHVCEGTSTSAWTSTISGGVNTNADQWKKIVDWGVAQGIDAVVVSGDLTVSPASGIFTAGCTSRFAALFRLWLNGAADLLVCVGNHDTELAWNAGGTGPDGLSTNPYYAMQDTFPELYQGKLSYYSKDIGPVRILSINDIADTTYDAGGSWDQQYANCSPPYRGLVYWQANGFPLGNSAWTNPDYSGITNQYSPQRRWINEQLQGSWPPWKVPVMHRGIWTPFPYGANRSGLYEARYDLWADLTAAGVDMVFQGDQHIVSWSKRIASYPASATVVNKADSTGAMSVALHGHYFRRSLDTGEMPAGSLLFSQGGADSGTVRWVYGMLGTYNGNRAEYRLVRTAQGPSPGYSLRVVTVATRAILSHGERDF